jgi:hypothetical protein
VKSKDERHAHANAMANLLRRCIECNLPLGKRDRFCPRCGARQPREPKGVMHLKWLTHDLSSRGGSDAAMAIS